MIPNRFAVLYTSLSREGAIAEITYHWGLLTPRPTKPAVLHRLRIEARKTVRIDRSDFQKLGITPTDLAEYPYARTQEVGEAAAFLGFDSLVVPSARSSTENLILFPDNLDPELHSVVLDSEEVTLSFQDQ